MLIDYAFSQSGVVLRVKLRDATSVWGAGLTGLTNASAGLRVGTIADTESAPTTYLQSNSTIDTVATLGTYAAPAANHCGFREVSASSHPGIYELQLANARFAVANARSLLVSVSGAAGLAECDVVIPLRAVDPAAGVRRGTAQAGGAQTLQLDAGASAVGNFYNGLLVYLLAGTGAGQARVVLSYNAINKTLAVDHAWLTTPDNTTVFALLPADSPALNANLQVSSNNTTVIVQSGTAQAGSTSTTIKLAATASATNGVYVGDLVNITGGTGQSQSRTIMAYNGTTKVATIAPAWAVVPTNTSNYSILASTTPSAFSDQGVAQAGTATTITLAPTSSTSDSVYDGALVSVLAGTGTGQTREITGYVGATHVATVDSAWAVNPDATSVYAVIPTAAQAGVSATNVNVVSWAGAPAQLDLLGFPVVDAGYFAGNPVVTDAGGSLLVDVAAWQGHVVTTPNVSGTPAVDVVRWGGAPAGSLPTNFSALAISAAGRVEVQTGITRGQPLPNFEFPMTDTVAHAMLPGLTVTAQRSLDGGVPAACDNAARGVAGGIYAIDLTGNDTNALVVSLLFTAPGADSRLVTLVTTN